MVRSSVTFKTGRGGPSTRKSKYFQAIRSARGAIYANRRLAPAGGGFFGQQRVRVGELNTIDLATATYVADTTGTVTLLNGVAQGDDFTDRQGRKIVSKSLYIRGLVKNVDSLSGPNLARLIIVYDNQPNGAAPAVLDVLKEATSCSQFNLNNRDRFRILADKQFGMGAIDNTATQTYATSPLLVAFKLYKKLHMETIFNNTGGTVTSISTGSIYMITIGDQAAGSGSTFKLSSRVRFADS